MINSQLLSYFFRWFSNDIMKFNPDKCHLLLINNGRGFDCGDHKNSPYEKLIGITTEQHIKFNKNF